MKVDKMLAALALCLMLGIPGLAKATVNFSFTTIDVPGSAQTAANGNSTQAIAGQFDDAGGITHGYVLRGGVFTQVDVPGAQGLTSVNGINATGQIAGTYAGTTRLHAYTSSGGSFTTLDPPGSIRSICGFVNAHGEVVGTYRDSHNKRHGFVWRDGVYTQLSINVPAEDPALGTVAQGNNDVGQVVGDYFGTDGLFHAFLLSDDHYTTIDPPGTAGVGAAAQGINDAGTVVGGYFDTSGNEHGFVLSNGTYTTVDVPGATGTQVNSINAQGQIVGLYIAGGTTHGFVGTPKP